MGARSQTGEWCPPTHEISGSQLVHLIDKSRKRDSAPLLDWVHDEPTRKSKTGVMEALRRDSSLEKKPVKKAPSFAPSNSEIDHAMALLGSSYTEDEPTPLPPPPVVTVPPAVEPAPPVEEPLPVDVDIEFEEPAPAEPPQVRGRSIVFLVLLGVLGGIAASYFCL